MVLQAVEAHFEAVKEAPAWRFPFEVGKEKARLTCNELIRSAQQCQHIPLFFEVEV